ncbi:MAG: DUF192 domain-containing protein [Candidatus Magasanikbacteria bacterium]|nr:DUF192 domain-containing protein [Candidatus Magasanikbacteria bacterium]
MNYPKISFNFVFFLIIVVLFTASLGYMKYREYFLPTVELKINGVVVTAEVAETPATWEKGLSGRKKLTEDKGMLFIFPNEDRHSFWMKDMNFPIDIIWIKNGEVVDIAPNVAPSLLRPLPTYLPRLPAKLVLETVAGFSTKNNLKIGDKVELLTE